MFLKDGAGRWRDAAKNSAVEVKPSGFTVCPGFLNKGVGQGIACFLLLVIFPNDKAHFNISTHSHASNKDGDVVYTRFLGSPSHIEMRWGVGGNNDDITGGSQGVLDGLYGKASGWHRC